MATGQTDLAEAFLEEMYDRTYIKYLDSTGLLRTDQMGRHIVDWMPSAREADETVALHEFTASVCCDECWDAVVLFVPLMI